MLKYRNTKIIDNNYLVDHFEKLNIADLTNNIGEEQYSNLYRINIDDVECVLKLYKIDPVIILNTNISFPEIETIAGMESNDETTVASESSDKTTDSIPAIKIKSNSEMIDSLSNSEQELKKKNIHPDNVNTYNVLIKEIIIMNKIKNIIDNNTCPNFLYLYYSNVLLQKLLNDKKEIYNIDSIDIYKLNLKSHYNVTDCYDGTLDDFFSEEHDIELYKSCVFQICVAVYCMQKYIGIYHNNLNTKNILFKFIDKHIVLNYNINNVKYYVPSHGFLFVITNFEESVFITKENFKLNRDFKYLKKLHHGPLKAVLRKNNIITPHDLLKIMNITSIKKIFDMLKLNDEPYNYYFSKNKKKISDELFSKIFYSSFTGNIIDFSKYYTKHTEQIVKLLNFYADVVFTSKDNIQTLLYTNFPEFLKNIYDGKNIKSFVL
jgi:hypothetical protein